MLSDSVGIHPQLRDPRFNLRKVVKDLLCIEEHISRPDERCAECLIKHALRLEAFAEEAAMLDRERTYQNALRHTLAALAALQETLKSAGVGTRHELDLAELERAWRQAATLRKQLELIVW